MPPLVKLSFSRPCRRNESAPHLFFRARFASLVGVFLLSAMATSAFSQAMDEQPPHDHMGPHRDRSADQAAIREAVRRGEVLPLPKVLEIAQKALPGDILEVELETESWGLKYEFTILTPTGLLRKVHINAKTGELVRITGANARPDS